MSRTRSVPRAGPSAAGPARVVTMRRVFQADVADVWDACTDRERLARWFLPVTGDLRVGGSYQLEGNASGTVETCDPPTGFTATWEYGGEVSWIEVRIAPEPAGGSSVTLEHIAKVDDERWTEFGPGAVGIGWDLTFLGLAAHLDSAVGYDPQESDRWMATDEGRQFMTVSSEQWCAASIAAGTDPAAAAAAAARTTAAYVGTPQPDQV